MRLYPQSKAILDDRAERARSAPDLEATRALADDIAALREAIREIMAAWAFGEDAQIATAIGAAWTLAGFREEVPCSMCGGRGWHTAGGNDPAACGQCPAGEAWANG